MKKHLKDLSHSREKVARKCHYKVHFLQYNDQKNETVEFYNYELHLEKFGFEYADAKLGFLYTVKMSTDKKKLIRKMTLGKKQENYFS